MKTHIILATLGALLLTACASHQGRTISSEDIERQQEEEAEYSHQDANANKDFN
jgi:hypothetical protein